jgi:hypothetical protein
MQIHTFPLVRIFDILRFKFYPYLVGWRDNNVIQGKTEQKYHRRRDKIRKQHPRKTYATRQYSNDFGVVSHFRGKKYNSNKNEQRTESVCIKRNHRQIKIENNLLQRRLFTDKIINMLTYVEYDYYHDYKQKNQEKRPDKFTHNIYV